MIKLIFMRTYYLHDGENEKGPFTIEELKLQNLKRDTQVWYEGLDAWMPTENVEELKSLFTQKPPPLNSAETYAENYIFPEKRNAAKYIWGAAAVIVVIIAGYLLYTNSENEKAVASLQQTLNQKDSEDAERRRKNDLLTAKNMEYRNNWSKYVVLKRGDFTYRAIGGIYGLDLTLINQTEYNLSKVEVEVDYIKTNGGIYKTEVVLFENIKPNIEKTLYAPDSDRGTSVEVRIKTIAAPSFRFCYNANSDGNGNVDDPWKCE
jgi:hypothetical protein